MCKLVLGISSTPDNKPFQKSITMQFEEMKSQRDGIGAFIITHDGKLSIFRELKDYDTVFEKVTDLLPNARVAGVHTRISTGGTTDLSNVHFFESGNTLLAHNGFVMAYNTFRKSPTKNKWEWNKDKTKLIEASNLTVTEQELMDESLSCGGCNSSRSGTCRIHFQKSILLKQAQEELDSSWLTEPAEAGLIKVGNPCDSLQFLQEIPKPITRESFRDFAEEKKMSGMMVAFDKKTKKLFINNQKESYGVSDKTTFSTFYSFKPETETEEKFDIWDWLFGVPLLNKTTTKKETIGFPAKKLSYGTFEVNY